MKVAPAWSTDLRTAAVTGTNGKSSTVWMLARMLSQLVGPVPSACTLGNYLGERQLPYDADYHGFLQTMRDGWQSGARHAVVEVTSQALALGMAKAWPFSLAIFTNLTHDHLDAHHSPEHYLASKAQLFIALPRDGVAIVNADEPASVLIEEVTPAHARILRVGVDSAATLDLRGRIDSVTSNGTSFTVQRGKQEWPAQITFIGEIFVRNALGALAAGEALGFELPILLAALARVKATPGRFTIVDAPRECSLIAIDYAHTPDALEKTLHTARALARHRSTASQRSHVWLIFGAGGNRDRSKRPAMGRAAQAADRIVLTNDNPRHEEPAAIVADLKSGLGDHSQVEVIFDRRQAIAFALQQADANDVVVIAGKGHEGPGHTDGNNEGGSDLAIVQRWLADADAG